MTLDPRIALRRAAPADLAWINARYADIAFAPSSADGEVQIVAEAERRLVGVGRLIDVGEAAELGGMYVDPAWRGCGIAGALVAALLLESGGRGVYCLPFVHLEPLYRAFGFADMPPELRPPEEIAAKFEWCRTQYDAPVSLLYRPASSR